MMGLEKSSHVTWRKGTQSPAELKPSGPSSGPEAGITAVLTGDANMSKRAAEFLEEWIGENAIIPLAGTPESDDSEARLLADQCLSDGKDEGIAKEDLEEEVGDLVTYMASRVEHFKMANQIRGDDREQRIRTKAFYIWLEEGCPQGRAQAHWDMATELVAIEKTPRSS
jgi:hypothetical protein